MTKDAQRRREGGGAKANPDGGFAAVDALVALLILSSTLVLSLGDLQTAARLSRIAEETGIATTFARGLLARSGEMSGEGRTEGLAWRLEVARPSAGEGGSVCTRRLVLRSLQDGRTYRFSTAAGCG